MSRRPRREVLVYVPKQYKNSIKFKSGVELSLMTQFNDIQKTIRHGEVLELPTLYDTILRKGDIIYFHHNIIRKQNSVQNRVVGGYYEVNARDGLFLCPPTEIFGYERDGVFKALDPYVYIKPIKKDIVRVGGLSTVRLNDEERNWGTIKYSNEKLESMGVSSGDTVILRQDGEYQFDINGEKLYRMRTDDVRLWITESNL